MMDFQVIKVKEDLLEQNDKRANKLREELKEKGIYFINVMASPGAGKTTLLANIINKLKSPAGCFKPTKSLCLIRISF